MISNLKYISLKSWLTCSVCFFLFFCSKNIFAQLPDRPSPPRAVNDFGNFLTDQEESQLEEKLKAYYKESSTAIVIVTLEDLDGNDASSYSFELAEKWGIGKKSKNNGILILTSKSPRKIFIANGYGVEEFITDAFTKRVVSTIITPEFKSGDFYAGFDKGSTAIIQKLEGKFTNDDVQEKKNKPMSVFIIVIIIIVFIIIKYSGGRSGRGSGILGGAGFIPFGGFTNFGGGGSSSGSDSFGGFGGGSFGGGGAGGDW